MRQVKFGATDLIVSEYGLGCARVGGIFQNDSARHLDLLAAAFAAGVTFFDTADIYSQGESEALIGRVFRGRRHRVVVASKVGYCLPARRRAAARLKPLLRPIIKRLGLRRERLPTSVRGSISQDFSPSYIEQAVEGSLRRLQSDYLDLLQLHSPPADVIERGDWVQALERLKQSGKVRYYGISSDSPEASLAALRFATVSSLQIRLNLLDQPEAESVLSEARAREVAVVARECLANGLLAKPLESVSFAAYAKSPEEVDGLRARLSALERLAAAGNQTLAAFSLKHVSALPGVSTTLVGASSVRQFEELAAALAGESDASANRAETYR